MTVLAGIFLIVHGLIHLGVWVTAPAEDAPFDPRRSWLLGEAGGGLIRAAAVAACLLFVAAGVLVLAGADLGPSLAVAGASLSLLLTFVTFNRWLAGNVAINIAIVAIVIA